MANHKFYPLNQSPLYALSSKRRMAKILGAPLERIRILSSPNFYNEFSTAKGREVQEPKPELKRIHRRIKTLLCRISPPPYLFSGVQGKGYIDNARYHQKNTHFLTTDIKTFYPSCKEIYVHKAFIMDFKMPPDVAGFLARLVTFNGIIPTGSPTSQILSYFAYSRTFDKLAKIAAESNMQFSLYVDDITFSSPKKIRKSFFTQIRHELNKVDLRLHAKKTRSYGASQYKKITGCAISPDGKLLAPNKLMKKIIDGLDALKKQPDEKIKNTVLGQIRSARNIQPGLFESVMARSK